MTVAPRRLELWATPGPAGAAAARVLYQPRRPRARIAHAVLARSLARLQPVSSLPGDLEATLAAVVQLASVEYDAAAAVHVRASNRWLFALRSGARGGTFVKLGRAGDAGLAREASALAQLATRPAIRVPRLAWHGEHDGFFAVATELVVRRSPRAEADLEDALALACRLATTERGFVVHGDFAPWNLVPVDGDVALVDWEASRFEEDPLYDLAHYVTRRGALLGAWSPRGAVERLTARGSVGWRCLERTGQDPGAAPEHVARYLRAGERRASSSEVVRYESAMAEIVSPSASVGGPPPVSRGREA